MLGVNPLANHSTYQCVYYDQLYFGNEDLTGMESWLWNSPQAVATESKPRYRDLLGPPCTCPLRGFQGVVLLSPKVWNGHHGGENLAIRIACFTNPPPLTGDQTHTHTHTYQGSAMQMEATKKGADNTEGVNGSWLSGVSLELLGLLYDGTGSTEVVPVTLSGASGNQHYRGDNGHHAYPTQYYT
jgi:hypothetical protein